MTSQTSNDAQRATSGERPRRMWWRRSRNVGELHDDEARTDAAPRWWVVVLDWLCELDWDFDD